jgi:hypothetical protein
MLQRGTLPHSALHSLRVSLELKLPRRRAKDLRDGRRTIGRAWGKRTRAPAEKAVTAGVSRLQPVSAKGGCQHDPSSDEYGGVRDDGAADSPASPPLCCSCVLDGGDANGRESEVTKPGTCKP